MSGEFDAPDYVEENRRLWNAGAAEWVAAGERNWSLTEPVWGTWGIAESELAMLPPDMAGMRAIELGCGTGYVSCWMARRGAAVTGVDVSEEQLATARRMATHHDLSVEWIHANAERVPKPDRSFDFAISEYGVALWAAPERWLAEAARLLVPGGRLAFLTAHPLAMICLPPDGSPVSESLHRPYFGMHRFDWTEVEIDPGGVEFNLTISDWFALVVDSGFRVEDLKEPRSRNDGPEIPFSVPAAWAHRYPSEVVIKAVRL